jgi:site-specific recombinase XerD
MKTVEAIKDKQQILNMKKYLKSHSSRDYCLFLLGINTGIRIHTLLHTQVKDVLSDSGSVFYYLPSDSIDYPPIYLNDQVRNAIKQCIDVEKLQQNDYLFKSRKTTHPISRQQAYRIINDAARDAGIEESIGTHTLRKTFGYHAFKKGIAISLIQKRLQQCTSSETLHYLGLKKDKSTEIELDVNL